MNKKMIILIVVLILVASLGLGLWLISSNTKENNHVNNTENKNVEENNDHENITNKKIAVIYFSATGNTKKVAEYIKNATGGDLIEIVPKEKYTDSDLNYGVDNSRANKEQNDPTSRPEIANNINTSSYNIIYLGYPIWWGDVPKIILTFLDSYNFQDKIIIPFCTSGSTSITGSLNTLKNYNANITWIEGKRFSASVTQNEITNWINSLNY